ncbi:MAG: XcyI family restriction endonuclease [Chloroflexi bacterium]|nr:XcyI family restriction endonuclease [Chloroflexota bacterium]
METNNDELPILPPDLQISFYNKLKTLRQYLLREGLSNAISKINLKLINNQLDDFVSSDSLKRVAEFGLRGEVFFSVPCILEANPRLLGYYRLLLGFSQKEFYNKLTFAHFKRLEEKGEIPEAIKVEIPKLCTSLVKSGEILVNNIDDLSDATVNELQLLTLGPQLRGGQNTKLGQDATRQVYELISRAVAKYIKSINKNAIVIENDSGRSVLIEFFSDPDVRITQLLENDFRRPLVSIEIKGGTDYSNIHNRLGEAEKSHQNAKANGFFEFWTIIRVDLDLNHAKKESPTTSYFFNLDRIEDRNSPDSKQFHAILNSILGIRN